MVKCQNCDYIPEKGDVFCRNCGEELIQDETYLCDCGAEVRNEDNYCHQCGASFNENKDKCKSCGVEIPDEVNFCPNCGTPIVRTASKYNESDDEVEEDVDRPEPINDIIYGPSNTAEQPSSTVEEPSSTAEEESPVAETEYVQGVEEKPYFEEKQGMDSTSEEISFEKHETVPNTEPVQENRGLAPENTISENSEEKKQEYGYRKNPDGSYTFIKS
ncbi:MAG: zinc ribbon domain-containing protein [Nanoarchaeota archaeon]|nr:zinc ribbon domain-containing protein [Nanoarchaeota archaeon]